MSFSASPKLFLAPMEGVGNRAFRTAMATIGGFDEACTEFLRVPKNAHIPSLAAQYNPHDTAPIPQAAQIMGSSPELMAEMTSVLFERGAHRVELNCGCPSNTVTGRGAGSSLLKEPMDLFKIARAMVQAASVPISIKLRSGFEDTTLLDENLLAAQEAGVSLLTLHPPHQTPGLHWKC
jgi:tRNA-dihydrouridine synthase C